MLKKLLIFFLMFALTCFGNVFAYDDYEAYNLKAKVITASDEETVNDGYTDYLIQNVRVKILDKRFKDEEFDIVYYLEDGINTRLPLYEKCKVGDIVYVYGLYENGKLSVDALAFYDKTPWIIAICIIYSLMIIIFGGKKGVKALLSLVITIVLIFKALVPAILNGYNPIVVTILLSSIVISLTFLIISGLSKKTLVAVSGTIAGVVAAGVIGFTFSNLMRLNGINEHARMISTAFSTEKEMISFKNVMLAAIMISALGACMDVGMSISSALCELKEKKPEMSKKQLIKSGMNIGRDVMGTMTNTLILAYVGSAMLCILLYSINDFELSFVLNAEDISTEVLKSLAGSIGLICTIPFTAILGGLVMGNKETPTKKKEEVIEEIPVNYFKG